MAHFAELDKNNVVLQVLKTDDYEEERGQKFLSEDLGLGGRWIKTSYNTRGGVHILGGTPFRKNFAGVVFSYDEVRDAFIPPKPFDSWILDEFSCLWVAPTPYPNDGERYVWNEETLSWVLTEEQK